ncbi:hypothetical protein PEWE109479_11055 [Pedobacter westerhofensis]
MIFIIKGSIGQMRQHHKKDETIINLESFR